MQSTKHSQSYVFVLILKAANLLVVITSKKNMKCILAMWRYTDIWYFNANRK